MHSATATTPIVAPRSVIVTRAATIQQQDRIRVGFAYLTRNAANCDLILPNALSSAESDSACSLASVFAAVAAPARPPGCFAARETRETSSSAPIGLIISGHKGTWRLALRDLVTRGRHEGYIAYEAID